MFQHKSDHIHSVPKTLPAVSHHTSCVKPHTLLTRLTRLSQLWTLLTSLTCLSVPHHPRYSDIVTLIFPKQARQVPFSGYEHSWISLPGTLFPMNFIWLIPTHPSELRSKVKAGGEINSMGMGELQTEHFTPTALPVMIWVQMCFSSRL